ncbi:peptidyl-tRNA hydrolase 2 [Coprinopsis sp. MPI-PUGE-AT-0042]|nr:peptidyl-tRNA hydrolase 2 [Coprinopsis sp. MPI-PUGE-AT-0042]
MPSSLKEFKELSFPIVLALSAASAGLGYFVGKRTVGPTVLESTSSPSLSNPSQSQIVSTPASKVAAIVKDGEEESEDEDEALADGDLSAIKPGTAEPCKMVLVVRSDLGMTSGKIAAQCGHATLAAYKALLRSNPSLLKHWERTGQAKIALKASSEDQLLELEAIAKSLNLCARSIVDAGRTQIAAGSRTVLAIGPAPIPVINQVTGHLRLL